MQSKESNSQQRLTKCTNFPVNRYPNQPHLVSYMNQYHACLSLDKLAEWLTKRGSLCVFESKRYHSFAIGLSSLDDELFPKKLE